MALALLDTNVLVHAVYRGSPAHAKAARLLSRGLREKGVFCIAPQNIVEFLSVVTRARFVDPPLAPGEAGRMAALLYRSRTLAKVYPKRGTVRRAVREGAAAAVTGARWYDLFLAATMKDAGVHVLVTENAKDFAGIPGIAVKSLSDAAG